jgi:hypothetical protein
MFWKTAVIRTDVGKITGCLQVACMKGLQEFASILLVYAIVRRTGQVRHSAISTQKRHREKTIPFSFQVLETENIVATSCPSIPVPFLRASPEPRADRQVDLPRLFARNFFNPKARCGFLLACTRNTAISYGHLGKEVAHHSLLKNE